MVTAGPAVPMHLMCHVGLQVYGLEPERNRIDVFDLLSDDRHIVHVGCRSAQRKSAKRPESHHLILVGRVQRMKC